MGKVAAEFMIVPLIFHKSPTWLIFRESHDEPHAADTERISRYPRRATVLIGDGERWLMGGGQDVAASACAWKDVRGAGSPGLCAPGLRHSARLRVG